MALNRIISTTLVFYLFIFLHVLLEHVNKAFLLFTILFFLFLDSDLVSQVLTLSSSSRNLLFLRSHNFSRRIALLVFVCALRLLDFCSHWLPIITVIHIMFRVLLLVIVLIILLGFFYLWKWFSILLIVSILKDFPWISFISNALIETALVFNHHNCGVLFGIISTLNYVWMSLALISTIDDNWVTCVALNRHHLIDIGLSHIVEISLVLLWLFKKNIYCRSRLSFFHLSSLSLHDSLLSAFKGTFDKDGIVFVVLRGWWMLV